MTNDQNLRTAAKKLCDVVDDLVACPFPERFSLRVWVPVAAKAEADLRATLTAPPRPDHAGGVEPSRTEIQALIDEVDALPNVERCLLDHNTREMILFAHRLAVPLRTMLTPAQAPDKAAEWEGVAEAFEDAALARDEAGYSGTPASCIRFLAAEVDRLTDLAHQPTGTEAGRGVGAFAPECHWGGGNDVIWCSTCGEEYAYAKGETRPACPRAATPTPPTPDSTAQGDGTRQEGER